MSARTEATVRAALLALYRKDDTATSESFQVAFATSSPMIKVIMGAFGAAVFAKLDKSAAQQVYHSSKRAMAGLVHGKVDKLVTARKDHAVRRRVDGFMAELDTFLTDIAEKNGADATKLRTRFYKRVLVGLSESGLDVSKLKLETAVTASTQGTSSMSKPAASLVEANLRSLSGVERPSTVTAAPAAAMPDWLKKMGRKGQQRYFAANPNSRYNPNRAARPAAPGAPKAAAGGHGSKIAQHINAKNTSAVSGHVRKGAAAGAAAASHVLDDATKQGAVGAAQKIQQGEPLDANDKKSLFKTALVGATGAALSAGALVGSALLAPVLLTDPNMVHGTLGHITDALKNHTDGALDNFNAIAHKVTDAAGEYMGKAGHFVTEKSGEAAERAEKLLGPETVQKLKELKSSGAAAAGAGAAAAGGALKDMHDKAGALYDQHIQPHLDKIGGAAKDAANTVKDKAETGLSHVKHAVRDAKEAINPTPPASNEQVNDAINKSGGEKPDYDKVTQKNTADPKLMDNDAPDQAARHPNQQPHGMSDEDYRRKIGEATKDAPGYSDKAPTVTTKGPTDIIKEKVGQAVDDAKKAGSDALDSGSKALNDVTDAAKTAHDHVKKAASDAINHIHKKATDAINDAQSQGQSLDSQIKQGSKEIGDKALQGVKDAGGKVADTVKKAGDLVQEDYEDLKNKGKAGIEGVKKGVSDFLLDKGLKKVDIK